MTDDLPAWRVHVRTAAAHARWLTPLACRSLRDALVSPRPRGPVRLILAIADHFEPTSGGVPAAQARERVAHWVEHYPRALGRFRDADGRPPRHSFFYPVEEYDRVHLDGLAQLTRAGYGEVEVHLHHDNDHAANLRRTLGDAVDLLAGRHGLLGRHRTTGAPGYVFVHGNWALNNARPDGRWCGVNDELRVLRATGCYADMTYPSAPSPTQPPTVNRIYRASGCAHRPRGHDLGVELGAGPAPPDSLLMVPGPLRLDWSRRKRGVFPRLENGCVQSSQPATAARVDAWLAAGVRVPSRPDWYFAKLHAHGATEYDRDTLIGPPAVAFHRALAERAAADPNFTFHYVTAREMVNLVLAAEAGWDGPVAAARDFEFRPPPAAVRGGPVRRPGQGGELPCRTAAD